MTTRLKVYVLKCPEEHTGEEEPKCKGYLIGISLSGQTFLTGFLSKEEAEKASILTPGLPEVKEALVIIQ